MARECTTALQKSLAWCDGMPQYPGIRRRAYYCNKNLIAKWPTLPRDVMGRPTSAKYIGSFELVEGAKFQYVDINPDKSQLTSEPQGEAPSQTQLNKLVLMHNGVDEEATGAAGYVNNSDNVYIVEDMAGNFRIVGNDKWPTKSTVNQDNGQGTSPAGTTINVEVTDELAAPFYEGVVETEDGDVYSSKVTADAATTPTVTPTSVTLAVNATKQLTMTPATGWTFESSAEGKATVSDAGLITGVEAGSATITCTHGTGADAVEIEVAVTVTAG